MLDFQDPNQSTKKLVDWFEELELNDPSRLGRFYTYPLGPNLLRTEQYGQPRRDHVVLGSRRVYSVGLLCFLMQSVFAAELTIFLSFHSLRMVLFLLSHIVVTLLALGTC